MPVYRKQALVDNDKQLMSPQDALEATDQVVKDFETNYWEINVIPEIKLATQRGEYSTKVYALSYNTAKRIASRGSSLGWRVKATKSHIVVSWGPRSWLKAIRDFLVTLAIFCTDLQVKYI